jgi:tRNA (adenine57-N1/adenine58-N1)-methyltransferase
MPLKSSTVSDGDLVLLIEASKLKNTFIFRVATSKSESMKKIGGLGVLDTNKLIGKEFGSILTIGRKKYILLQPDLIDEIGNLQRKAQIITPKDSAVIIINCDIKNGDTVIEGGLGSGALTLVLANLVKPDGKIISYDISAANIKVGKNNLNRFGLDDFVEIKKKDIIKGITEKNVDAVILDIPEPWLAVEHAYNALKPGGHFASYSPTMNQVELTIRKLNQHDFIQIHTIETLQREIVVSEGGTRPSFDMLGHTGYVSLARKILENVND